MDKGVRLYGAVDSDMSIMWANYFAISAYLSAS